MFKLRRDICLLALLPLLTACNVVVSEEPWFAKADTVGAPALRDGLWVNVSDDCKVDETKPTEQWPDCAGATYVRGNEWLSMQWEEVGRGRRARRSFAGWEAMPTLIAAGTPLILQVGGESASSAPRGDATDTNDADFEWHYWYQAFRPTQFDDAGRVTAFEMWPVKCGPEPTGPEPGSVTERPFPGLTIIEDNCLAKDVDALRRAAALSEDLGVWRTSRWVRDGWR